MVGVVGVVGVMGMMGVDSRCCCAKWVCGGELVLCADVVARFLMNLV